MTPDVQHMKLLTTALDNANAAARALQTINLSGAGRAQGSGQERAFSRQGPARHRARRGARRRQDTEKP